MGAGFAERPWLARYRADYPTDLTPEYPSMLALFEASLARAPQTEIVRYFDGVLTLAELDELSDAFAVALTDRGFAPGDRLATYLQNIPQAVVAVVGTWKAGGVVVSINPMSRQRELTTLLTDCEATAIVSQEDLWEQVAAEVVASYPDGVWFVELAPIGDARLVPQAVATVLGVREEPGRSIQDALLQSFGLTSANVYVDILWLAEDGSEIVVRVSSRCVVSFFSTCPTALLSRRASAVKLRNSWLR